MQQGNPDLALKVADLLAGRRLGDVQRAAARPKCSASATATKYRTWRSSI
jgi:outer membrane protein TolC